MIPRFAYRSPRRMAGLRIRHALGLTLLASACMTAADRNEALPTGLTGQTGGTGGSSSGGGANYSGTYHLTTVNDSAVPHQLAYDSATGTGSIGDTTRVFAATIDSSILSLNTDSSAVEMDYLTIRDDRTADSNFTRTVSFGDTTTGTYSVSQTTVTVTRTDTVGGTHQVVTQFSAANSQLTGTLNYVLYNTDGGIGAVGEAAFAYTYTGPPASQRTRDGSQPAIARRTRTRINDVGAELNLWRWHPPSLRPLLALHGTRP